MFSKKILATVVALTAVLPTFAGDDFGLWTAVNAEKDFGKRITLDAGVSFRADDNVTRAARWDAGLGISVKATKFLKLGAGYSFIVDHSNWEYKENYNKEGKRNGWNVDHPYWRNKHRAYFEVQGSHKFGRFKFSLRERYQYTHYVGTKTNRDQYRDALQPGYTGPTYTTDGINGEEYMELRNTTDEKPTKNKHLLRSRLKVEYNIKKCPVTPFVSYEVYNDFSNAFKVDKHRYSAGGEWKIKKKHSISLAYLYQHGAGDDDGGNTHAIDLSFKFSL